jgi:hypothetical protein
MNKERPLISPEDAIRVINQRVDVIVTFNKKGTINNLCYPYKMNWEGQEIKFTELGLRHPTSKGQRMIHVFDMSDGHSDYRLEFDAEGLAWTLSTILSIT